MSSQKGKSKIAVKKHMLPPILNLDEYPLVDVHLKILETRCEFKLYELHNWAFQKFEYASEKNQFLGIYVTSICLSLNVLFS